MKQSFFDAIDANKRNSNIMILLVFILFLGLVWAFSYILGLDEIGFFIGGMILIIYFAYAYGSADSMLLSSEKAKPLEKKKYPFIYNVVEGLSIAANIPIPKIYIIDDPSPNAFAVGKDPKNASIAVTRGLIEMMSREELEGVLAHEVSHIANYDTRFMMYTIVFVGAIALLANIAWRSIFWGGGRKKGSGYLAIAALILMILAPIFAELIRFAISRQREYLADANAGKLTRYPPGLASALNKIKTANKPMKTATDAAAPLYIMNPFAGNARHLFSTHPPVDERIKRLKSMY